MLKKWRWVHGAWMGMIFFSIIIGIMFFISSFNLSAPQKVAVQTIQQLYSGDPKQMIQAFENCESDMSWVKTKIQQDFQGFHSSEFSNLPKGTVKIQGEIGEILDENSSHFSLQMIDR